MKVRMSVGWMSSLRIRESGLVEVGEAKEISTYHTVSHGLGTVWEIGATSKTEVYETASGVRFQVKRGNAPLFDHVFFMI